MTCAWPAEIESNAIAKTKTPRFRRRVFALGGWCFAEDESLRVGCIRHEIILLNYRSYSHAQGSSLLMRTTRPRQRTRMLSVRVMSGGSVSVNSTLVPSET